jgi:hypothetical protein
VITLLVYLVIIGVVWFVVDRFLLQPYAPAMIRTVFNIIVILCVLIWLLNAFGLTHISVPVKTRD